MKEAFEKRFREIAVEEWEQDDLLIDRDADVDILTDEETGIPTGEAWVLARVFVSIDNPKTRACAGPGCGEDAEIDGLCGDCYATEKED